MGIPQVIQLLSGVALFLFGMGLMGDGLKKVSGNKLEPILYKLSGTPLKGILLGTGVTAVIQSSSATSVMVVGFVNAGIMKVRQAIYLILGSILGTSITGWIICLSYIDAGSGLASLLSTATLTGIIAVGGTVLRMVSKKQTHQSIADIMMGFAVLMFGMSTMSGSVSALGKEPWFTDLLTTVSNPVLGILVGVLFAAVLQSASAAVGILQALSVTGAMTFSATLPLLMGVAIGASVPVLLSALGANLPGKRTAVSYLVASSMGVLVFASLFYIGEGIFRFPFVNDIMNPFSTAWVNTILRLVMLLLLAPFGDVLEKVAELIVPARKVSVEEDPTLRLEERFLAYPALAIEQSRLTVNDMASQSETAIGVSLSLLSLFTEANFQRVKALEDAGDHYEDALSAYLVRLTAQPLSEQQSREASIYLQTLSDFERLTDHALNIAQSAQELHDKKLPFSPEAKAELEVLIRAVEEILHLTVHAFTADDRDAIKQVEPLEEVIDGLCSEVRMRHVDRLQKGSCTIGQGFVFNDLVSNLERVSDHCSNIAVARLEMDGAAMDTHEYLNRLKEKRTPEFERFYEGFRQRFTLA
ncbi:MAG: Na/Pi cotransporter family protein [Clostridia bacterium]|nr:Na/Pi cotransporter family protein [Clostridia bacterium]